MNFDLHGGSGVEFTAYEMMKQGAVASFTL